MDSKNTKEADIAKIKAQAARNIEYEPSELPWINCWKINREDNRKKAMNINAAVLAATLVILVIISVFGENKEGLCVSLVAFSFAACLIIAFAIDTLQVCMPGGNWKPGETYRAPRFYTHSPVYWAFIWPWYRFPGLQEMIWLAETTRERRVSMTRFGKLTFQTRICNRDSAKFPEKVEYSEISEFADLYFDAKYIYFHFQECNPSDKLGPV